jgi:hypothetical protein
MLTIASPGAGAGPMQWCERLDHAMPPLDGITSSLHSSSTYDGLRQMSNFSKKAQIELILLRRNSSHHALFRPNSYCRTALLTSTKQARGIRLRLFRYLC